MNVIHRTRVSTKGQITIPKDFRDKLNVKVGDKVTLIMTDDSIVVKPEVARMRTLRGLLKDEIDITKATNFIDAERKKWRL